MEEETGRGRQSGKVEASEAKTRIKWLNHKVGAASRWKPVQVTPSSIPSFLFKPFSCPPSFCLIPIPVASFFRVIRVFGGNLRPLFAKPDTVTSAKSGIPKNPKIFPI